MPRKTPYYWLTLRIGNHYSDNALPIYEKITGEDDALIRLFLYIYAQKLLQMEAIIDYPITARLLDNKTGEKIELNYSLKDIKTAENGIVKI